MKNEKALDYFLQFLMVVMGVFLGMMASEWSSNRNLEENKKNLLIGLRTEISENLKYLEARKSKDLIPFFKSLDSLTKVLKTETTILEEPFKARSFEERVPGFPGLGRPQLDDAMYDATKFSGLLSSLDVGLLQQLTRSYNLQYNIQEIRKPIELRLISIDSYTLYADVLDLLWEIMQSYFGAQYNLIIEYKKSIALIDKLYKAPKK